jgi:hypothetical protein
VKAQTVVDVVSEMALAARMPLPRVCLMEDPAPNAFATGHSPDAPKPFPEPSPAIRRFANGSHAFMLCCTRHPPYLRNLPRKSGPGGVRRPRSWSRNEDKPGRDGESYGINDPGAPR